MIFLTEIEEMTERTISRAEDNYDEAAITFDDGTAIFIKAVSPCGDSVELEVQRPEMLEQRKYGWISQEEYDAWSARVDAENAAREARHERAEYARLKAKFDAPK
jgi:hypothetical protein